MSSRRDFLKTAALAGAAMKVGSGGENGSHPKLEEFGYGDVSLAASSLP